MIDPIQRRATRDDLDALPRSVVGELIQGVLYTRTRPRPRHAGAASVLGGDLNGPYQRGRGGPGGWWILDEPGIELAALDVEEIVPDVAGWQRARLPALPDGPITIAPDWVCEVLSPSSPWWKSRVPRTPSAAALARRETEGIPGVFRGRATQSASSGAVLSVRGTTAPDVDEPIDPTGTTAPADDEPFDPSGGDCSRVPDEDPTCAELGLPPIAYACFLEDVAPGCIQTRETYLLRCCPGV